MSGRAQAHSGSSTVPGARDETESRGSTDKSELEKRSAVAAGVPDLVRALMERTFAVSGGQRIQSGVHQGAPA
ncbi:hypothetical protein AOLI_G00130100 [Acnodon oligacanthus]